MYRMIVSLLFIAFISGCGPKKLTQEDIIKEKKAVESVALSYNKLVAAKNTEAILNLFSNSINIINVFFIGCPNLSLTITKPLKIFNIKFLSYYL